MPRFAARLALAASSLVLASTAALAQEPRAVPVADLVKQVNIPKEKIEIFWDQEFILRELAVKVLKEWKKDLKSSDYYDSKQPRQRVAQRCDAQ